MGDKLVQVLRDTGCSSAAIKSDLVRPEQLTGDVHLCRLIDGTLRRFPIARVKVDTSYLTGEIEALCIRDPIYDLIIGNLPGVTDAEGSSEEVSTDPEESVTETPSAVAQAVMTRGHRKEAQKDLKPLVAADMPAWIQDLSVDQVVQAQDADEPLVKVRKLAETGERMLTRDRQEYQFLNEGGVLYRKYSQPRGDTAEVLKQEVVPVKFRDQIMRLAHESMVGGHLGVQKTLDRITSSFQWPGISANVTRYYRSCDIIMSKNNPQG